MTTARKIYKHGVIVTKQTEVQTLIFDKKSFKTASAAKRWAKEHDFKASKVDETDDSFRLRQAEPGDFVRLRTIELREGVKAVVGPMKKSESLADVVQKAHGSEGGAHVHILERSESQTRMDGRHTHLFMLPDGSFVETEFDGPHGHEFDGEGADFIEDEGGKHTHQVIMPDRSVLTTGDEKSAHTHELQVETTTADGIHAHSLLLPDGQELVSIWPGQFFEMMQRSGILQEKTEKAVITAPTTFITIGPNDTPSLLVKGDLNFLVDAPGGVTETEIRRHVSTLDGVFVTDKNHQERADTIARAFKAGLIVPKDENEVETVSKAVQFFPRRVPAGGRKEFGIMIKTETGNVAWAPRFSAMPKWVDADIKLAFLGGSPDPESTIAKANELGVSQVVVTRAMDKGRNSETLMQSVAKDGQSFLVKGNAGKDRVRTKIDMTPDAVMALASLGIGVRTSVHTKNGNGSGGRVLQWKQLLGCIEKGEGQAEVLSRIPIKKIDEDQRLVYGIVSAVDEFDAHGDIMSADTIEKAAHHFLEHSRVVGIAHKDVAKAVVVESYIAPVEFEMGGEVVKKGDWVLGCRVDDPEHWRMVKSGRFNSYSVGGWALKKPL